MISRNLFSPDHDIFRDNVRRFVEQEIRPFHAQWEEDGVVPRSIWRRAGELGFLCCNLPEEYGGYSADWLYNVIVIEEMARGLASGPSFMASSEMCAPYILAWAGEQEKRRLLPGFVSGETIGAIAMTEPGAGSDVASIRTRAVRDGDHYVISGQKLYISNGQLCDLVVVACKTDPDAGAKGISLIMVETNRPGFTRGRNLKKIGLKAQDTSELFFDEVRVPASNLLGEEGRGFGMLMTKLPLERLVQAIRSVSVAEAAIEWTVEYTSQRKAFGHTIADFQNTQFKLAELEARTSSVRVFVDWCIQRLIEDALSPVDAAKVKLVATDLHCEVVNECLQFFGGYGYMLEYPIAQAYIDARISRIAGGSAEVMKQIIGRDLFKGKLSPKKSAAG